MSQFDIVEYVHSLHCIVLEFNSNIYNSSLDNYVLYHVILTVCVMYLVLYNNKNTPKRKENK
jgi:hypothetical protein